MWLLLALVLLLVVLGHEMRRFVRNMRTVPAPLPLPLLGNAHLFFGLSPAEACLRIGELAEKYGDTFGLFLGPSYSVMLFNPRDVERVLSTSQWLTKSQEYSFLGRWLNEGLLVSSGRKWHRRRKIITPAFHFKILEAYVEVFDRQSLRLVEELGSRRSGGQDTNPPINLGEAIHLCTLDAICETAMGVSINAQSNADSEYVQAVKTISMVLHKRMFNILYRFDLTYMLTPLARAEKKALNVLHQFTEKIIVQRREEIIRGGSSQENRTEHADADVGAKRKMAFLDILLQSTVDERPLSNLDIREEVDTFMFEGHDTTSSALMFFFYNIATHPEAQSKCFEEVRSVVGQDKSTPVTYDLLNQLHYVDLCVKETLRMYPSVPLLGRKVLEDCEINGKLIPAGTNIGISPLYLGRQEELFSEPNSFKPERFDVVTSAEKLNPYAYIPFSAGPRNCIGQKFAMLEIKAIVANVLRHYQVDFVGDSSEPPVLIAELILRTKDPLMFKLRERVY
ncbi:cytochrome P450 4d1 isoform X2 [Drosophila ficusphila]|uniref:cytochrome P450 4d1 isoform X2 n=1 Tax=Drosophila ficusphila TaxID=30025 RepID=UPI0007E765A3|nr:cytochrome P450 4d1 isoform X2 [Drosophila ficusphila]